MKQLNCPLCHGKVYSSIGEGCKLCGMPLENENDEFCSMRCNEIYDGINQEYDN